MGEAISRQQSFRELSVSGCPKAALTWALLSSPHIFRAAAVIMIYKAAVRLGNAGGSERFGSLLGPGDCGHLLARAAWT